MAALHELAPAYYEAADRLTEKINKLKLDMEGADPMRRGLLQTLINHYVGVRKDVKKTAKLCEHYYEEGFYRGICDYRPASAIPRRASKSASLGAGKRAGQQRGTQPREEEHKDRYNGAAYEQAADILVGVLLRGHQHEGNRRKRGRKHIDSEQNR